MSQENCPANCRTFLVRDEPATEDAFDGPHRKVAEALVSILKEDGGRAVGLEGDWGSGKSTVVEIAREQLKEDKNIEFFVFDAWAHEGDALRRSFLSERHLR